MTWKQNSIDTHQTLLQDCPPQPEFNKCIFYLLNSIVLAFLANVQQGLQKQLEYTLSCLPDMYQKPSKYIDASYTGHALVIPAVSTSKSLLSIATLYTGTYKAG